MMMGPDTGQHVSVWKVCEFQIHANSAMLSDLWSRNVDDHGIGWTLGYRYQRKKNAFDEALKNNRLSLRIRIAFEVKGGGALLL